ncbi:hypothetical protein SRHO_G00028820 [Serrasalmus rhombeus]
MRSPPQELQAKKLTMECLGKPAPDQELSTGDHDSETTLAALGAARGSQVACCYVHGTRQAATTSTEPGRPAAIELYSVSLAISQTVGRTFRPSATEDSASTVFPITPPGKTRTGEISLEPPPYHNP